MTLYKTDVDVAGTCSVHHILTMFERHEARIVNFVAEGPGGGNPNFELAFATRGQALAFLREFYDDQGFEDADLEKMVTEADPSA